MSSRLKRRENRLCELVDGTLVEKAVGFEEGRLALRLGRLIDAYVDENDLGVCVGADGMMRIAPGLVRIPDVSFIAWESLPGRESPQEPIPDLAPDLAVEVLSEGNTKGEMARKVRRVFRGRRHPGLADRSQETNRPGLYGRRQVGPCPRGSVARRR